MQYETSHYYKHVVGVPMDPTEVKGEVPQPTEGAAQAKPPSPGGEPEARADQGGTGPKSHQIASVEGDAAEPMPAHACQTERT